MADVEVFERGNPEALEAGQYAVLGITKQLNKDKTSIDNVLNSYRSVTYNFTISVLNQSELKNHSYIGKRDLKNVILKSGGRGSRRIEDIEGPAEQQSTENPVYDRNDFLNNEKNKITTANLKFNKALIDQ